MTKLASDIQNPSGRGITLFYVSSSGITASLPLAKRVVQIGSAQDNDLVLDGADIEAHHLRIELDGSDVKVTDLTSVGSTYLADIQLLPNTPEKWPSGRALRVAGYWLHLQQADTSPPPPPLKGTSTSIGLQLATPELAVEPGENISGTLDVWNEGSRVDQVQISLHGIPAEWAPALPPVRLMPGERQSVTITIQPPRSAQSQAGSHPLTIRATSQNAPGQPVEASANLNIAAYHQFTLELRPQKQRASAASLFQAVVNNQGNSELTVQLTATDPEQACTYTFMPAQLSLAAGQSARLPLTVQTASRSFWKAQAYPFTLTASQVDGPKLTQQAQGEWLQLPQLRWLWGLLITLVLSGLAWLVTFLILLQPFREKYLLKEEADAYARIIGLYAGGVVLLLGVLWFLWTLRRQRSKPLQLPPTTLLTLLLCTTLLIGCDREPQTKAQATAVALATMQAEQAAHETATAVWLTGDDDKDGLPNGKEVDLRSNPRNPDSDDDSILDGKDPDPLHPPTPTETPTFTDTPVSPTPTATATNTAVPPTSTSTATVTPSHTPTVPTDTPTPTPTNTSTVTPSYTPTVTPTFTDTPTPTNTPLPIWNVIKTFSFTNLLPYGSGHRNLAWSPDDEYFAVTENMNVQVWRVADWTRFQVLTGNASSILSVAWSPDGKKLAATSGDKTIRIWDITTNNVLVDVTIEEIDYPTFSSIAWSPDGARLAVEMGSYVLIIDTFTGAKLHVIETGTDWAVAWSPDGTMLAASVAEMEQHKVVIWDTINWQRIHELEDCDIVTSIDWSPNSLYLAFTTYASYDYPYTLYTWRLDSNPTLEWAKYVNNTTWSVNWSLNARWLLIGDSTGTVTVFASSSGNELFSTSSSGQVYNVVWSPNSKRFAVAAGDDRVAVYELTTDE